MVFPVKFADEAIPHLESLRKGVELYGFILRGPRRPREKPANPEKFKGSQKRISLAIAIGVVEREDKNVKPKIFEVNFGRMAAHGEQSKDVLLQEGDVIYVPPTILAAVAMKIEEFIRPIGRALSGTYMVGAVGRGGYSGTGHYSGGGGGGGY